MIKIGLPVLKKQQKGRILSCCITADYLGGEKDIWFSVNEPFEDYLVNEVCDAYLLACLLPAICHHEDIVLEAAVSEKLYFNSIHSLVYMLSKSYNALPVDIIATRTIKTDFGGKGVGCGCSLGIDSLAAIFTHLKTSLTPDYQITHLTYFNVGSHGYKNAEANRRSWEKDMVAVDRFAEEVGLPVVKIESNVYELFDGFNFDQSGNLINMSTVLTMQKLFGKYLYGSNYPMRDVRLSNICSGYFETIMLPASSTESTELIVANADMTRSDKTRMVVKHELSRKNLYVCWKELIVNNNPDHPIAKIKDKYLNCTRCDKCLRTCTQLDILGVLEDYNEIFDIDYYNKVKDHYIGKVLAQQKSNGYYRDIVEMAQKENYQFSLKSKIICFGYRTSLIQIYWKVKGLFINR